MKPLKNKKQIGTFIVALMISVLGISQDTLSLRNGSTELVKVIEISTVLVKYKKVDNPDGPTYSELKNDISFIRYKNGMKETFEYQVPVKPIEKQATTYVIERKTYPELRAFGATKFLYGNNIINNKEMHSVLLSVNDRKISEHIRLAQKQAKGQYIGFAFFPCAIAGVFFASESREMRLNDETMAAVVAGVAGVACFATSITLKVKRTQNEAAAVKLYNQKY